MKAGNAVFRMLIDLSAAFDILDYRILLQSRQTRRRRIEIIRISFSKALPQVVCVDDKYSQSVVQHSKAPFVPSRTIHCTLYLWAR